MNPKLKLTATMDPRWLEHTYRDNRGRHQVDVGVVL